VERLVVVLGDQLDASSGALRDLDVRSDAVLMMEVREEATHVPSHVQRGALFLSAMRHFADSLRDKRIRVRYTRLDDPSNTHSFTGEVGRAVAEHKPRVVRLVRPGEHRVLDKVRTWSRRFRTRVEVLEDSHFLTDLSDFEAWLSRRRRPVMDHFYRERRRRLGVLVSSQGKPTGGKWSLDAANRQSFRTDPEPPRPPRFRADTTTRQVVELVRRSFPSRRRVRSTPSTGTSSHVTRAVWPVTLG
jgi:deoxyribodipyrimidine photolyase-related protein